MIRCTIAATKAKVRAIKIAVNTTLFAANIMIYIKQTFSVTEHILNILGFAKQKILVTT